MNRTSFRNRIKNLVKYDLDAYILFRSDIATARADLDNEFLFQDGLVLEEIDTSNRSHVAGLARLIQSNTGTSTSTGEVLCRLNSHNRCFVVRDNQDIVGMRWIAEAGSEIYEKFAGVVKDYPNSRVFNNAYVLPQYRGRQLQRRLDQLMKKRLRNEGVRTTFVFVGVKNFASMHNCHLSNDEYRLIYHLTIDLPLLRKISFYPKLEAENWRPCWRKQGTAGAADGKSR